jgi:hypothetical protein
MPVIKQYTRTVNPTQLDRSQATAAAFGGDQSGLRQLAGEFSELSAQLELKKRKQEESDYIAKVSQFELENMRRLDELKSQEFEDGVDFSEVYASDVRARAEALDVPASMRDRWRQDSSSMQIQFAKQGINEQSRREGVKAKLNFENTVDAARNMIAIDPSRYYEATDLVTQQVGSMAGLNEIDRVAVLDGAIDGLNATYANGIIEKNPYQFDKMINEGKFKDLPNLQKFIARSDAKKKQIVAKQQSAIMSEYKNYNKFLTMGIGFNSDKAKEIERQARAAGMNDVADDIAFTESVKQEVTQFAQAPMPNQQAALEQAMVYLQDNPTPENLKRYGMLAKSYEEKTKILKNGDALDYYQNINVIPEIAPIDVTDVSSVLQGLDDRKSAQRIIAEREGFSIPILKKEEVKAIQQHFDSLPAQEKTNYVIEIANTVGEKDAGMIAALVSGEDANLAAVLSVAVENPKAVQDSILGQQRTKMSSRKEVSRLVNTELMGTGVDAVTAEQFTDMLHNIYEERLIKSGEPDLDVFNEDLMSEVMDDVIGPRISPNSSKVLSFRKNDGQYISEGQFETLMSKTTPEALSDIFGNAPSLSGSGVRMSNEQLQDFFDDFSLVNVGDGVYNLVNPNDPNQVVVGMDGRPFMFDFKKLSSVIDSRTSFEKSVDANVPFTAMKAVIEQKFGDIDTRPLPNALEYEE